MAIRSTNNRNSSSRIILFVVLVLVVGGIGIAATLALTGNFQFKKKVRPAKKIPGAIYVPIATREIPAYSALQRGHVLIPRTIRIAQKALPAKAVKELKIITMEDTKKPGKFFGRVLRNNHPPGFAFTEDSFFDKGTRPGIPSGAPLGHYVYSIDSKRLKGPVFALSRGDRIDLIATYPLNLGSFLPSGLDKNRWASIKLEMEHTKHAAQEKFNAVRVLVRDALVIQPPASPIRKKGAKPLSPTEKQIVLSVRPTEVTYLTQALGARLEIVCIARSNRAKPKSESESDGIEEGDIKEAKHKQKLPVLAKEIPDALPEPPEVSIIEVIKGGKHQIIRLADEQSPALRNTLRYPEGAAPPKKEANKGKTAKKRPPPKLP